MNKKKRKYRTAVIICMICSKSQNSLKTTKKKDSIVKKFEIK